MTAGRLIKRIIITGAVHRKMKIAQVARDLGVSRSWASREAHNRERWFDWCRGFQPRTPKRAAD